MTTDRKSDLQVRMELLLMEMKWQDQRRQLASEDKTKHLRINLIRNIWKLFKTIRFLCLTLVLLNKLDLVNLKKVITYALN